MAIPLFGISTSQPNIVVPQNRSETFGDIFTRAFLQGSEQEHQRRQSAHAREHDKDILARRTEALREQARLENRMARERTLLSDRLDTARSTRQGHIIEANPVILESIKNQGYDQDTIDQHIYTVGGKKYINPAWFAQVSQLAAQREYEETESPYDPTAVIRGYDRRLGTDLVGGVRAQESPGGELLTRGEVAGLVQSAKLGQALLNYDADQMRALASGNSNDLKQTELMAAAQKRYAELMQVGELQRRHPQTGELIDITDFDIPSGVSRQDMKSAVALTQAYLEAGIPVDPSQLRLLSAQGFTVTPALNPQQIIDQWTTDHSGDDYKRIGTRLSSYFRQNVEDPNNGLAQFFGVGHNRDVTSNPGAFAARLKEDSFAQALFAMYDRFKRDPALWAKHIRTNANEISRVYGSELIRLMGQIDPAFAPYVDELMGAVNRGGMRPIDPNFRIEDYGAARNPVPTPERAVYTGPDSTGVQREFQTPGRLLGNRSDINREILSDAWAHRFSINPEAMAEVDTFVTDIANIESREALVALLDQRLRDHIRWAEQMGTLDDPVTQQHLAFLNWIKDEASQRGNLEKVQNILVKSFSDAVDKAQKD